MGPSAARETTPEQPLMEIGAGFDLVNQPARPEIFRRPGGIKLEMDATFVVRRWAAALGAKRPSASLGYRPRSPVAEPSPRNSRSLLDQSTGPTTAGQKHGHGTRGHGNLRPRKLKAM